MKLRQPLSKKKHATTISAYAPTMTSTEESNEQFYADLNSILCLVTVSDKLILLGDFNAHIGCNCSQWEGALGKHGVGKMNSNGLLLLSK